MRRHPIRQNGCVSPPGNAEGFGTSGSRKCGHQDLLHVKVYQGIEYQALVEWNTIRRLIAPQQLIPNFCSEKSNGKLNAGHL
jgi:hypothetical protein